MMAVWSLWKRELIRFYRQRSRVIGAVGSPLVFWLLIGSGIGSSFQASGNLDQLSYLQYFFPGTLLLILLFTSIFSTISLIEDRREGFLQGVLVAPVSRFSIVLGKVLGGTTLAFLQGILFLLIAPLIGIRLSAEGWMTAGFFLVLNSFTLTALGFALAWRFNSVQGFHAVMNLLLMPLWILSGALFPAEGASPWLQWIMKLNPLTYGLQSLRQALFPLTADGPLYFPALITAFFGAGLLVLSAWMSRRRSEKDLV